MPNIDISYEITTALEKKQFIVYYQPQYSHSTGMLLGAEALVRWNHPLLGLIPPTDFIQAFEKQKKIPELDLYVFEHVCQFICKCKQNNSHFVPISVNIHRYDIERKDFIAQIEKIRNLYGVQTNQIHLEITESVAINNLEQVMEFFHTVHNLGYLVEMDDFGSGYSSLNVLKDIDFDVIKLDMKFLAGGNDSRGGIIISSVVRMAKWLCVPVIAEGVETKEQADFMVSIGCDCIQGFLYSRPISESDFLKMLSADVIGVMKPTMKLIDPFEAIHFWNPDSLETMMFNNFVGGAAIFEFKNDNKIEILRANEKYLKELGMNNSLKEVLITDPFDTFDEDSKNRFIATIHKAIETNEEQEWETWVNVKSEYCGNDKIYVRNAIRMIGKSEAGAMFFSSIRNITAEKVMQDELQRADANFKMAVEQAQVYLWEYNISTKEMKPCFRCMRDLGLPPLVLNYPEPVIANGIFPPDYADMFRDWHRQLEKGVKSLEAVIPLTAARIPHIVRYTTEFDENGNPVKAYGSATKIIEN